MNHVKTTCDWLCIVGGAIATLKGWIPEAAGFVSIVWGSLQIWQFFKRKSWRKP